MLVILRKLNSLFRPRLRIFISYSSKDKEVAMTLYNLLGYLHYPCIIDNYHFGVGEPIHHSVQRQIRVADVVLLLLTPNSRQSAWVRKEHDLAQRERKMFFPILNFEDLDPNEYPYLQQRRMFTLDQWSLFDAVLQFDKRFKQVFDLVV